MAKLNEEKKQIEAEMQRARSKIKALKGDKRDIISFEDSEEESSDLDPLQAELNLIEEKREQLKVFKFERD